jgi:hypothetical protein
VPHLRVQAVVRLLAVDLCREPGDFPVVRLLEPFEPRRVRLFIEDVSRDRLLPVEQTELDELRALVLVRRSVERELVGGYTAIASNELVDRSRMADLVLRDRREGDVLLQQRSDAGPLGVAPAEDELVVSDLEQRARLLLVHGPP